MGNFWSTSSYFGFLASVVQKQHCKTWVFCLFFRLQMHCTTSRITGQAQKKNPARGRVFGVVIACIKGLILVQLPGTHNQIL